MRTLRALDWGSVSASPAYGEKSRQMLGAKVKAMNEVFGRIAEWLGVSTMQAKGITFGFIILVLMGVGLAGSAGTGLYEEYSAVDQNEAPDVEESRNPLDRQIEYMKERQKLPTFLSEGQVIPDAEPRPNGEVLLCGRVLSGRSGLQRGWVWSEEEEGCRRVARQP